MPLSDIDAVLAAAQLLLPVREATGQNDGRFVNAIQAATGNASGQPWCASYVGYVGSGMLGRRWPLPLSGSCDVLLAFARKRAWLVEKPQRGDVFLRLASDADADHCGFVLTVDPGGRFYAMEGNTNDDGSRDGIGVFRRLRGAASDHSRYVFVRWSQAADVPFAPAA